MTIILPIISVVIVSLISFVGAVSLSLNEKTLKKYVFIFVSLAVGALLGDAFIHLIPEAFEQSNSPTTVSMLIIAGILGFFILEKLLHWHHHSIDTEEHIHPAGKLILVSDSMHNFVDGLLIGTSFLISTEIGIATTIAVILHEIPQEIGDFAVLIYSGYSKLRALFLNFLSALFAIIGVLASFILSDFSEALTLWILPFGAGGFIYVAATDLIPELHKTRQSGQGLIQIVSIIIGIGLMILLLNLE